MLGYWVGDLRGQNAISSHKANLRVWMHYGSQVFKRTLLSCFIPQTTQLDSGVLKKFVGPYVER